MKVTASALAFVAGVLALVLFLSGPVRAANEGEAGEQLIKLMQAGRGVISAHQELINDQKKGNKGFTPDYMGDKMMDKYKEMTKVDLRQPGSTPHAKVLLA